MLRAANGAGNILRGCAVAGRLGAIGAPGPVFVLGTELCTMPTDPDPQKHEVQQRYAAVRKQVHEAFDHVALSLSCTLPMLLGETRSRGIKDDDVRNILAADETEAASRLGSAMRLQCYRSNAGVLYITRDTAPDNQQASSFDAFAELWRHDCHD